VSPAIWICPSVKCFSFFFSLPKCFWCCVFVLTFFRRCYPSPQVLLHLLHWAGPPLEVHYTRPSTTTLVTLRTGPGLPGCCKSLVPVSKPSVIEIRPMFQLGSASGRETRQARSAKAHRSSARRRAPVPPGCAERFAAGHPPAAGRRPWACTVHACATTHPLQVRPLHIYCSAQGAQAAGPEQLAATAGVRPRPLSLLPFTFAAAVSCLLAVASSDRSLTVTAPVLHSLDCKPVHNSTLLMTSSSTHSVQRLVALALEQYTMPPLTATRFAS